MLTLPPFFRSPLGCIALLAGLIALVYYALAGDPVQRIIISQADIDRLTSQWQAQYSQEPSEQQLQAIMEGYIREEVLYRQARRLELGHGDAIIRRRMVQKFQFITAQQSISEAPSKADLATFFAASGLSYQRPATLSFRHLYFSRASGRTGDYGSDDSHGGAKEQVIDSIAALNGRKNTDGDWQQFGEAFMLEREYTGMGQAQLTQLFGAEFAQSLQDLAIGPWWGPVPSAFGWHGVRILAHTPASMPAQEEISDQLLSDYYTQRRQQRAEEVYQQALTHYQIIIEKN